MTGRQSNAELSQTLADYLAQRRALGFALIEEGRHARRFLEWLWVHGNTDAAFTCAKAIEWARGPDGLAAPPTRISSTCSTDTPEPQPPPEQ